MIRSFRNPFRAAPAPAAAAVPAGQRVYAIGDIHGRLDLFEALIAAIEADDTAHGSADTTVILLGDLIDRGPDSAGVIAAARAWQARRKVRILMGNHEEMFLGAFSKIDVLRHFLRFGGRETVLSYPIDRAAYDNATLEQTRSLIAAAVPARDLDFIRTFEDAVEIGDYLFVHAGIAPGVALADQQVHNLRWIRHEFLDHRADHGHVVVHGHTIAAEPEFRSNRIGIDTGAYMHGRLTALVLEGTGRRLIMAGDNAGSIETQTRNAA